MFCSNTTSVVYPLSTLVPDGWSFLSQTREQMQADLGSCQAKIVDLEKALAERGQVTKTRDGDRSSLVLLSLALLHVCVAALLLGWRCADQVFRRILWCHFLHVWCRSSCSASPSILPVVGSVSSWAFQCCRGLPGEKAQLWIDWCTWS